jgi:hypothetical protein
MITREEWQHAIRAETRNTDGPGDDRLWAPELDAAPSERLREIQSRKLVAGVEWMYGRSALFRSKCETLGLVPGTSGVSTTSRSCRSHGRRR